MKCKISTGITRGMDRTNLQNFKIKDYKSFNFNRHPKNVLTIN